MIGKPQLTDAERLRLDRIYGLLLEKNRLISRVAGAAAERAYNRAQMEDAQVWAAREASRLLREASDQLAVASGRKEPPGNDPKIVQL